MVKKLTKVQKKKQKSLKTDESFLEKHGCFGSLIFYLLMIILGILIIGTSVSISGRIFLFPQHFHYHSMFICGHYLFL
ncbi:hypothetical protein EFE32_11080 [Lactococcus lactis subsp. lactis]|uniref:hypothetical protein n=1 Tax=Lactococcus lactis TaxID=1358 RepID=UPI00223B5B0D|nr:hypothetical protein [Lactococcus lactis]MCT0017341.1 hypothetical protein [Lactococcus lactis subsp. lactis]